MTCCCCGCPRLLHQDVLWLELIAAWGLSAPEVATINRQQGLHCADCGCNLRTMALAAAVMQTFGFAGLFRDFVRRRAAQRLRVLEVNEAGLLTPFLKQLPGHVLTVYPEVDMTALPWPAESFDLVLHSDTLEHVPEPVQALAECQRVLKPGGRCAFTVPLLVDRLTRSRAGMPPSYHGNPSNPGDCLVHTEYGADAWKHVVLAGFDECRVHCLEYPAASALVGVRAAVPSRTVWPLAALGRALPHFTSGLFRHLSRSA
jgi:SAM-dependent methyltransferase